jgi:NADPH-dependent curcumin reductase CurA
VVPPVVQQLVDWTLEGRLRGAPDQVYGLDQAGEALSALFDRRSAGKMVIRP